MWDHEYRGIHPMVPRKAGKVKKMKVVNVYLLLDQIEAIQKIFKDTGARPSETIRRALSEYLEARKGKGGR
jgi:Ribbon-helix-helix protein, copG family